MIHSVFALRQRSQSGSAQWARGAEAVGVDVFIDVVALRAGSNWEVELFRQVPSKDLFGLFWSKPARESQWVDMEGAVRWRHAAWTTFIPLRWWILALYLHLTN
jgi:TIR domain